MTQEEKHFQDPLYKKWFRTPTNAGFLSIVPWFDPDKGIMKLTVDIGESDPKTESLKSSSNAFVDAFVFGAFMTSIANGSAKVNYPKGFGKSLSDRPTDEALSFYGGSGDTSRIFRVHHWKIDKDKYDTKAFVFKIGHFKGVTKNNGAIVPDTSQPISRNLIKVTRAEICQIAYTINAKVIAAQSGHRV